MPNHQKPTQEELDASIAKTQEDLDKMDKEESTEDEEVRKKAEEASKATEESNETENEDEEDTETEEETSKKEEAKPEEKPTEAKTEEEKPKQPQLPDEKVDYKKRFSDSTREAQILAAKNKQIQEAISAASTLPVPTDEEMKKEFTTWDDLDEFQKKIARDNIWNQRKVDAITNASLLGKDIDKWTGEVDAFIENPKTLIAIPELEGKQEKFKIFAAKESRRGVDFETLVGSFLFEVEKSKPAPKKGKMFEVGSGGPNEKPKQVDAKLSVEDASKLMETDYKKYKELLIAGKIANE